MTGQPIPDRWRWIKRWKVGVAGVVATALYVIQGVLRQHIPGWLQWTLIGAGTILTVAALALTQEAASRESDKRVATEIATRGTEQAVLKYQTKVNDGLKSFVTLLDGVVNATTSENRKALQRAMVEATINFAALVLGTERTRACFFEYDAGPPRKLKRVSSTGRNDEPRDEFVAGTPEGDHIFAVLDSNSGTLLWPDVDLKPPPGESRTTTYKTFISAKVASGAKLSGMLGVDSPYAGSLTENDEIFVGIIAHMLGIARASGVRRSGNSR